MRNVMSLIITISPHGATEITKKNILDLERFPFVALCFSVALFLAIV